jgi:hypothetical protein
MKVNPLPLVVAGSATIESRVQKLLFIATSAIVNYATTEDFINAFTAQLKLEKQTSSGEVTKIYQQDLITLLEIASHTEGAVVVKKGATHYELRGTLELSDEGAIQLSGNDYFTVYLSGNAANISVDIFAVDSDDRAQTENTYAPIRLNANAPKTLAVAASKWLSIDETALRSVKLILHTGQQLLFTVEELKELVNEKNPISFIIDGKVTTGGRKMVTVNVGWAVSAEVLCSADTNAILVNQIQTN